MKLNIAFDNFAKFFEDEDSVVAPIPSEVFRNESGDITEVRIYNAEYEQMVVVDRNGNIEALSVEEFENEINK